MKDGQQYFRNLINYSVLIDNLSNKCNKSNCNIKTLFKFYSQNLVFNLNFYETYEIYF